MSEDLLSQAEPLREEYLDLQKEMADPQLHSNPSKSRKVGRRYAELSPIIKALQEHENLVEDLAAAEELAEEDAEFAAEAERLRIALVESTEKCTTLLVPRDPMDSEDAILEIQSGAGGEESALFAGDLLRMYLKFAEKVGWKIEIIDEQATELGGYKSVMIAVKAGSSEKTPYGTLKFEGGVHRVQRVPVTESQGRIHTSATGVLVMPDVEADEIEINDDDLRVDVYRSSGPGGQGVNTTDSAVRITHLPTGVVVSCQNERSQLQNREQCMRMLRAKLTQMAADQAAAEAAESRKSQIRTVDRSERIRTYNFPENRISDHRIGYKAHNLDQVLEGELTELLDALAEAELAERLEHLGSE